MEDQIEAFLDVFSHEEPVSFACYPNPFTDELHLLVASETMASTELMVFDLMGRCCYRSPVVLSYGLSEITINPELSPGIYVLKIGETAQRIVKY